MAEGEKVLGLIGGFHVHRKARGGGGGLVLRDGVQGRGKGFLVSFSSFISGLGVHTRRGIVFYSMHVHGSSRAVLDIKGS
jgi:hypothetical protein